MEIADPDRRKPLVIGAKRREEKAAYDRDVRCGEIVKLARDSIRNEVPRGAARSGEITGTNVESPPLERAKKPTPPESRGVSWATTRGTG